MSLISLVSKWVNEEEDDLPETGATVANIINSNETVTAKNLIFLNAVIANAKNCKNLTTYTNKQ